VAINTVNRVDATLEVGAVSQTVQVNASAAVLQTDRADVHHDISAQTLEQVPLPPGNNFQTLMRVIPGATPPTTAHSIATNPTRSLDFSVNGTSDYGNTVRIDGVTQYNIWVPENTSYIPSSDAIETVNVTTANFSPEQGLAGGSMTNVEIKSGTNQLHGDAYEYHFDNNTEAHNFFDPNNKITRKPKDIFNQFGASIGGPIKKDKLFYFSNVEWIRQRQFATATRTIPTANMAAGDLTGLDPANGLTGNPDIVYDPTTATRMGRDDRRFTPPTIPAILPITRLVHQRPVPQHDPDQPHQSCRGQDDGSAVPGAGTIPAKRQFHGAQRQLSCRHGLLFRPVQYRRQD